jgi:pSer/pThr/pTyr-binding forkhead associated (FHA) protein
LLGGTVFKVAVVILGSAEPARLAALVAVGALVGFFVGLVQDIFKQAWIKVMVGRNEGKEYLVTKPITAIGRSELSDIGLYGDPAIAPTHAVIEALPEQNRHRLRHVAGNNGPQPYPPTFVNGQPVTAEQWLTDGDTIQIGRRQLLFQERATRRTPARAVAAAASPGPAAPRVQQVPNEAVGAPAPAPPAMTSNQGPAWLPPQTAMPTAPDIVRPTQYKPLEPGPPAAMAVGVPADVTVRMDSTAADAGLTGTRFSCTSGPYMGQSFLLSHAAVFIGRATDRDISLAADSSVSRNHAVVTYERGRHIVADDGSSNGTKVNGQLLSGPRPLRVGDRVQLGETVLVYE